MIEILIADDHPIVRQGLRKIVEETSDITVVDEVESGQKGIDKVRQNQYDVVVLDIVMPDISGLDVLKQIKSEKPALPVLILSMYPEEQYALRALKAGAAGYLTKGSAPKELISAIQQVHSGKKYITIALAGELASHLEADTLKPLHETLSDREYQVMCMIASGKTVKEIAEEMSLSVPTISTYRARLLEKMKMKNNAEIMYYAIKHGLVI